MKLTPNAQGAAGLALVIMGAWVIREAWEGSGRRRPFWLSMIPG